MILPSQATAVRPLCLPQEERRRGVLPAECRARSSMRGHLPKGGGKGSIIPSRTAPLGLVPHGVSREVQGEGGGCPAPGFSRGLGGRRGRKGSSFPRNLVSFTHGDTRGNSTSSTDPPRHTSSSGSMEGTLL